MIMMVEMLKVTKRCWRGDDGDDKKMLKSWQYGDLSHHSHHLPGATLSGTTIRANKLRNIALANISHCFVSFVSCDRISKFHLSLPGDRGRSMVCVGRAWRPISGRGRCPAPLSPSFFATRCTRLKVSRILWQLCFCLQSEGQTIGFIGSLSSKWAFGRCSFCSRVVYGTKVSVPTNGLSFSIFGL